MNKDLACTFQLARELIAGNQCWYICIALDQLYRQGSIQGLEHDQACSIIQNRLGSGAASVESWLCRSVPEFKSWYTSADYCDQVMVDYRLRWLDSLIKEFS